MQTKNHRKALETSPPSRPPQSAPKPSGGPRFELLLLIIVVVVINIPFVEGRCMVAHDTRFALGIFDYFYSNYLFAGELPRWMVYGVYGLNASLFHVTFMSGASYLAMFVGKLLMVKDSLQLFAITLCLEQMLLLLGVYLLCRRLFQERLTVFCICLTAICTVMWDSQISLNFRLYYLLPLEFYCILRLEQDENGCFGWLAGIVAILGPLGSVPYFYPLWALLATIFSISLFWGKFRSLRCMFKLSMANFAAAAIFLLLAATFAIGLARAMNNVANLSPHRGGTGGSVSIGTFLTYGGNDFGEMWKSLFLPSANVAEFSGRMGMNDYVGLVTILCLPLAFGRLRIPHCRSFAILAAALFALSRGGVLASAAYYFPGMHLFRHVGYLTAVMKLLLVILAGFGLDALIFSLRDGSFARYCNVRILFLALLAVTFYLDLYVGGAPWATFLGDPPPPPPGSTVPLWSPSAVYPLLRAALIAMFAVTVWIYFRRRRAPAAILPKVVLFALLACVAGDGALFQFEMFSLLHPAAARIDFPAVKLASAYERSDQIPDALKSKYMAWSQTQGQQYQIAVASALQWDPLSPHFRTDWFPRNVLDMMQILGPVSTNDFKVVCGSKFRLVSRAIPVSSNSQALALLESQAGWDDRVILTDPGGAAISPSNTPSTIMGSRLNLDDFSANSLSLSVSNASAAPVWLVYADAYIPAWHATVNGKPAQILEAYGAFKAIRLEPGDSKVQMSYDEGLPSTCLTCFAAAAGLATAMLLASLLWLAVMEVLPRRGRLPG